MPIPNQMTSSQHGVDFISSFEGLSLTSYHGGGDAPDIFTIGFGTIQYPDGSKVQLGQSCTKQQALDYLAFEMKTKADFVNAHVNVQLTQNQFDALVSFAYNCGCGNLQSSTLLKLVNAGNFTSAANQFIMWNRANHVVLAGLTRRRNAEAALFIAPDSPDASNTVV